jgi:hypothetical protein
MFAYDERRSPNATRRSGPESSMRPTWPTAWRRAFARFGVKPTRYRSAVEAWLATYQPQGQIKSYVLSPAKPHTGSSESADNESH